jgi:signal transduction histidine kinase
MRGLLILLACCRGASGLSPSLDISQYAHKAWTVREGFFRGAVNSIAQTRDGYLWLGTEFGLVRFDGVRSVPWGPSSGEHLPSNDILKLLVTHDGRLWIGTTAGLASWNDGRLTHYPELDGQGTLALLEDSQGTTWASSAGSPMGKLCAIQSGKVQCSGEDGALGRGVVSLYEHWSSLWVGAGTGLWQWKPGAPRLHRMPGPPSEIFDLVAGDNSRLLIAVNGEMKQLVDGRAAAYPVPGGGRFRPYRLLRDHEGGLWMGSASQGLLHVHQGRTDQFGSAEGLSGENVNCLFEDREGNVWVGTNDGLDRFRDFAVPTLSSKQGFSRTVVSALAARDGSVWFSTTDGLNRWNDGQITIYRKRGDPLGLRAARPPAVREIYDNGLPDNAMGALGEDDRGRIWVSTIRGVAYFEDGRFIPVRSLPSRNVYSIAEESAGSLWAYDLDQCFHLLNGLVVERIPWDKLGHKDQATALIPDRVRGGVWLGFLQGGVSYFKDGQVRASYAAGEGRVKSLQFDRDGTLWAATRGGLSRVKNGRVATLTSRDGLPCDAIHWVAEDDSHSFWLYLECGLARIDRSELDAWAGDPKRTVKATVFDSSDGVTSQWSAGSFSPQVAKSLDGKLWFVNRGGVSVIDPPHLPFNKLPPPVHIEQITADRKTHDASSKLRLPALTRDLEIEYTALSFVAPEKNRFRVKLEGRDPDWKDIGNERKAFYNDLPPRNYRFRVMASNNSGVWNEAGDSFDFSIDAAYYQTRWFQASCVAAFLGLLWVLYRYRLHQIAQRFNTRLDERARIARELHDTLLQSFHGLMFRYQAARNMLPRRPEEAMQTLDGALERTEQAIVEGRDAIHGLRASTVVTNELAQAVTALGVEMRPLDSSRESTSSFGRFHVVVEGQPRELHPILRDEVYSIAREAVRNAFRHAQAHDIEVEIAYNVSSFRLRIRDDGKGIDPRSSPEDAADTTVCRECASAPSASAGSWTYGLKPGRARRWSCASRDRLHTGHLAGALFLGYSVRRR